MFGRWISVKIQAAQTALRDGRIDDAWQIVADPQVREARRGGKLLDELARPLFARARLHAQAGRYGDSLEDLERLESIGRLDADAEALRQRAMGELNHRQQTSAERRETYERAAANVRAGRLESGRLAIEQIAADDRKREQLAAELDIRVKRSEQLLDRAREALKSGEVLTAVRMWEDARNRHGRTAETEGFAGELLAAYRKALEGWLAKGTLDRFMAAVRGAGALQGVDPSLEVFENLRGLIATAASQLGRGDYHGMRRTLLRLGAACGEARWVKELLASLDGLMQAQDKLLGSPLGVFAHAVEKSRRIGTIEPQKTHDNERAVPLALNPLPDGRGSAGAPPHGRGSAGVPPYERGVVENDGRRPEPNRDRQGAGPPPLLLLVDGTGSSLLVHRDTVRLGRADGKAGVDVPIPADMQSHHADIVRHGEDYFLMANGPTQVNHKPVSRVLLRDGDRITLGANGKLVFRRPSDRSGSAVLLLSDRCRAPQDVDRVVLLKDTCMIGPDPSAHIRTREGDTRLVAFMRDGQLSIRRRPRNGGGGPADVDPLELGQTKDFGDLRLTLKAYDARVGRDEMS